MLGEIDRIADHINLSLTELLQKVDEEIGIGPNQGPRQKGPNTGVDEHGVVSRVKDARWTGKNAEFFRVTITLEAGM